MQGAFVLISSTGATEDGASGRSSAARRHQLYFVKPSFKRARRFRRFASGMLRTPATHT